MDVSKLLKKYRYKESFRKRRNDEADQRVQERRMQRREEAAMKRANRIRQRKLAKLKEKGQDLREEQYMLKSLLANRKAAARARSIQHFREIKEEKIIREKWEREARGDKQGEYYIILTRNKVQNRILQSFEWWNDAIDAFNNSVRKNEEEHIFSRQDLPSLGHSDNYEILLVKRNYNEEDDGIRQFKDKYGQYTRCSTDTPDYVITNKAEWRTNTRLTVIHDDGTKEHRPAKWVYDNVISNNIGLDSMRNIFTKGKSIIVDRYTSFTRISCKSHDDAVFILSRFESKLNESGPVPFVVISEHYLGDEARLEDRMRGHCVVKSPVPETVKCTPSTLASMVSEGS